MDSYLFVDRGGEDVCDVSVRGYALPSNLDNFFDILSQPPFKLWLASEDLDYVVYAMPYKNYMVLISVEFPIQVSVVGDDANPESSIEKISDTDCDALCVLLSRIFHCRVGLTKAFARTFYSSSSFYDAEISLTYNNYMYCDGIRECCERGTIQDALFYYWFNDVGYEFPELKDMAERWGDFVQSYQYTVDGNGRIARFWPEQLFSLIESIDIQTGNTHKNLRVLYQFHR